MKRLATWLTVCFLLTGAAFSQSLGDVARANRMTPKKKAARVYTNDDIPEAKIAPAPQPVADAENKPATEPKSKDAKDEASKEVTGEAAKDGSADQPKDTKTGQPTADSKKPVDPDAGAKSLEQVYRLRSSMQKDTVTLLQRELDVLQREFEIQTTVYYSDAGTRLRNPKDWVDQRKKFEDGITAKAQQLAEAKSSLQAIRDEARKAGVPASAVE